MASSPSWLCRRTYHTRCMAHAPWWPLGGPVSGKVANEWHYMPLRTSIVRWPPDASGCRPPCSRDRAHLAGSAALGVLILRSGRGRAEGGSAFYSAVDFKQYCRLSMATQRQRVARRWRAVVRPVRRAVSLWGPRTLGSPRSRSCDDDGKTALENTRRGHTNGPRSTVVSGPRRIDSRLSA